jgi:outer membrane protein TolC
MSVSVLRWPLLGLLLVACAATPYRAPPVECPAVAGAAPVAWWKSFADPQLLSLLSELGRCNVELANKVLRVRYYRLAEGRSDISAKGLLMAKETAALDGGGAVRSHALEATVSYELDLWGKVAREHEADAWQTRVSEAEWQALLLSLQSEVAGVYWQLTAGQRERRLQQEIVGLAERLWRLEIRAQALGAVAASEVRLRYQAWLDRREALDRLDARIQQLRERQAALLDQPQLAAVRSLGAEDVAMPEQLPEVPSGLPADMLLQRPDIAAGVAELRRLMARKDIAAARFLPELTLTGLLGAASPALRQWLSQPAAGLVGSLSLPLFDHNLTIARDQAQIEVEIAAGNYRRLVNGALREVDDALTSRQRLHQEVERALVQWSLARDEENEARRRWRAGDADSRLPLLARMRRLEWESRLLVLRSEQKINLATLFKAMGGGGWPHG